MNNRKSVLYLLGLVLVFASAAAATDYPRLTYKFTYPISLGQNTAPSGVNDAGVVVGWYSDSLVGFHGFILNGENVTTLDDPNATYEGGTLAYGVNSNPGSVLIAGSYQSSKTGNSVGFLYDAANETYTDIPGPSRAVNTYAEAINDSGVIVGSYSDSAGIYHGFLLKGKKYRTLDVPGARGTIRTGINNKNNVVVQWSDSSGNIESSLYDVETGTFTTINYPNAISSWANGIDDAGDIVYTWEDSSGSVFGGVEHEGTFYQIPTPGEYATGVNNKGEITGYYWAGNPFPAQMGFTLQVTE